MAKVNSPHIGRKKNSTAADLLAPSLGLCEEDDKKSQGASTSLRTLRKKDQRRREPWPAGELGGRGGRFG